MSTALFVLLAAGIIFLAFYHKPVNHTDAELKKWFSGRLQKIAENLDADIDKDNKGEYPHAGAQTFNKHGKITYVLLDKNHARFDISDKNSLSRRDILETAGYRLLENKVHQLNLELRLEENDVDGDGVDSFNSLDEYIDDIQRYYTVTISGW